MPAFVLAALLSASADPNFTESIPIVPPAFLYATGMEWAPDGSGRLFIIGQGGLVHIVKNGNVLPFATLTPVFTMSECGLVGMAFDPDFVSNGFVYFFITVSSSEQRIVRLTAVGDLGTQPVILVSGLATIGANHDGGGLVFGHDGKLYWGIGDNGNASGIGGDLMSTAAKIGRVNRDGTIPSDNPYVGVAGADRRIWASGFRNPFTMSVQPRTGSIWINNVGTTYETIFAPKAGENAGYNGYEIEQLPPYIRPILWYRTNGTQTYPLLSVARVAGVATYSTPVSHHLHVGQNIAITGVADATFNGAGQIVTAVISNSKFSVARAGPDASSTGGQAATLDIGGAITGGAFLDTSAVPAAYRGNFFFADFNSGNLTRVALGPNHLPSAVTPFATGLGSITDVAMGPDGALYVLRISGSVLRFAFNAPSPTGVVVAPLSRNLLEGGQAVFDVSLAAAPTANVTLTATRSSGDADLSVTAGHALTFTPASWNVPQSIRVAAAQDADTANDAAVVTVMGAGFTPESIDVSVTDDDVPALLVTPPFLQLTEGSAAIVTVALEFAPTAPVTVTVARTAGDPDVSITAGASLTFDASNYGTPQPVTVLAAEDADTVAGAATVSLTAPGFPTRTVAVTEVENDAVAPIITSPPADSAIAGAPWRYDVDATGVPPPTFALIAGPPGMAIDATTGVLTWTPPAPGAYPVRVRAANGVLPDWAQNFVLSVAADRAPTAVLTKPQPHDVVSGRNAELFGDGVDDVGTVQGVFSIDGADVFTDTTTPGDHYHLGGAHNRWDTTALANGPHVVRLTVTDTAGQTGFVEAAFVVDNPIDAGAPKPDAGLPAVDGGLGPVAPPRGCGCASAPASLLALLALVGLRRQPSQFCSRLRARWYRSVSSLRFVVTSTMKPTTARPSPERNSAPIRGSRTP